MGRKTVMNDITSPKLLKKVSYENISLMNDFLEYLRSVQRSETTINGYRNDLEIAWVWGLEHNNNRVFTEWTKRNIVKFQNWLINENGNSPARVRRVRSALSSLSNYICNVLDDEYPDFQNIIGKIEAPAAHPVREKTVWEEGEIEDLLGKLVEKKQYDRACLVALALYSGRRKSELVRFRVDDFDNEHLICDGALYKSSPIKTKGRGLGKYINCYTLAKKFRPYLELWMDERERRGITSEWLFVSPVDQESQMHAKTLDGWAEAFSKLTGKPFYFHSLRHAFTTNLVRAGIPDSVVTEILGWESMDMCKLYTDISADEMIGMYFKDGEISTEGKKQLADV